MKKRDITEILIKEGWVKCQMRNAKVPTLLFHPTKFICYKTSTYTAPGKSFFFPTQYCMQEMLRNPSTVAGDPGRVGVFRYIGIGDWGRLEHRPDLKLIVDSTEFLALNYGV